MTRPADFSPALSLIFLVFNEQQNLDAVVDEAVAYATDRLRDWEIVIVDDGSTDSSGDIAAARSRIDSRIRVVNHIHNAGMGAAMASGIRAAEKSWLVFLPADGQTPIRALDRMLPLLDRADIVVTSYENRRESRVRAGLSAGLRAYMRVIAGIRFKLEGLYVFPVPVARSIAPEIRSRTFFFSFELIDRALARGVGLAHTTMRCLPRASGRSKVTNLRRIYRVGREVACYALRKRLAV